MKLLTELYNLNPLIEAVSIDTAFNTLKSTTNRQLSVIKTITQKIKRMTKEKDFSLDGFDMLKRGGKGLWFKDNYLSSDQFGVNGLQTAAAYLAKRSKKENVRNVFKKISNYHLSASADKEKTKELGKSTMFDDIVDQLVSVRHSIEDPGLVKSLDSVSAVLSDMDTAESAYFKAKTDYESNLAKTERKAKKVADPSKGMAGKQNQQAEDAFNQIIKSLPKPVQKQIRADVNRMSPSQKMAYLQKNM